MFASENAGLGRAFDKVPFSSRAITGTLPNGLKYFILENSLPENRAHLALVVNAGSVLERDDERGFAHFVEHLAFNDTERFPKLELIEYLRSLGSRFGADANAYTSYDETVYHFDVPVETIDGVKRIPSRALAIIDDWTHAVSFNTEDIENEKRVVLEELRARLGVRARQRKIILPVLFEGSAYADRDVIGLAEIIEGATREKLKGFYDRWYRSDNMALVFVGDFDGRALQAELAQHFNMPKSTSPVNRPRFELPRPRSGNFQVEIFTDPEMTSTEFSFFFRQRRTNARDSISYYRDTLLNSLISVMIDRRFEEIVSDPDSGATEFYAGIWQWSGNSRFFTMETNAKTGRAQDALRELLLEKESIRRFGFTESELQQAKLSVKSYMENLLAEKDRTNSRRFVRGFTNHFIHNDIFADIEWEMDAVNALLPVIGVNEVNRTARNYFSSNDIKVFLFAPSAEAENLPSKTRIKEIFNETQNTQLTARQSVSISGDLMSMLPVPGSIVQERVDAQTGAVMITLSNGANIILKQTENRNNEIVFYAMANGGTANATAENIVSAGLLAEMLNVSGLGNYSRTELNNKLTGKQVSVSFFNSSYFRGFQGSSVTQDINTLFEMIHLFFTEPRLDERAIAAMLDSYRTTLAHQREDPQRFFNQELTKLINSNHPLFMPLEAQDLSRVSIEQARAFLNRCLNPSDYTFIFTGNIDVNSMRDLLSTYLASIPNSVSMNTRNNPNVTRPGESRRTIRKGVDNRCTVYLGWFENAPREFNEHRNQTAAILSEYMDIVLTDEIREKLGGVYSISAGASVSVIPSGEYRISAYFVCDPERADELIAAVRSNLTNIARRPLNEDTFNKAREALLTQHYRALQNNLHIAQSYANSAVLYSTPLNRLNQRPYSIRAVSMQDVQSLCRDMLRSGPVQLLMFPQGRE